MNKKEKIKNIRQLILKSFFIKKDKSILLLSLTDKLNEIQLDKLLFLLEGFESRINKSLSKNKESLESFIKGLNDLLKNPKKKFLKNLEIQETSNEKTPDEILSKLS